MARIDVTENLHDPDFVDDVEIVNRNPSVNLHGENDPLADTTIKTVGSVQPADYKTIMRLPEAFRVTQPFSFWVNAEIIASEPGKYSSIIKFKGKIYQVQTVADWSSWGAGWTEGTCVAQVPA